MTKRALKRHVREGAFDAGQFQGDDKIRRLPLDRAWSPLNHHNDDRDQGYLKTIKAKSPGQQELIAAIDAKNWSWPWARPAPARPTWPSPRRSRRLESGSVARIVLSRPAVEAGESIGYLPGDAEDKLAPYLRPLYDALS
jgi:phosphate starvation-inducible PhoH-like protein